MSSVASSISFTAVVMFYLAILLTGFDFRRKNDRYFSKSNRNRLGGKLVVFVGSLPMFIPVLLFLTNYSFNLKNSFIAAGWAGGTLFVSYLVLYRINKSSSQKIDGPRDGINNNTVYNLYLVLSNFGLKLPIIVFAYTAILEPQFGNFAFLSIVVIITVTGLLLMSRGLSAYIYTGIIIGLGFLLSLMVLTVMRFTGNQSLQIIHGIMGTAGPASKLDPLWCIPLSLVLVGIWIIDLQYPMNWEMKQNYNGLGRKLINGNTVLVVLLIIVCGAMARGNSYLYPENLVSLHLLDKLQFNGFLLIVVSGLFIFEIMSIFQLISHTITFQVYKKYRRNTNEEILKLVSRLSIVLFVAIAVLLTPLFALITFRTFQILMTIYIVLSVPVFAVYLYSIVKPNLKRHTIVFSLLGGWFPGLLICGLILAGIITRIHIFQFFSIHLLYSCLLILILSINIENSHVSRITLYQHKTDSLGRVKKERENDEKE